MAVSISTPAAPAPEHPAQPPASGPACAIRAHSGAGPRPLGSLTLWQLGIEAQEITSSIAHLADQLASDDDSTRASAITDLEATLLAEERTKECPASTPLADSRQSSWPVSAPRLSLATTWGRRHEN